MLWGVVRALGHPLLKAPIPNRLTDYKAYKAHTATLTSLPEHRTELPVLCLLLQTRVA